MDDIIEKLYAEFGARKEPRPEREKETLAEYGSMCDQVQSAFGLEFLDRMTLLKAELDRADDITSFRQGVRLGARLALELELFRPA